MQYEWSLVDTLDYLLFLKLKLFSILEELFVYMLYIYLGVSIIQEDQDIVEAAYILLTSSSN